MNQEPDIATFLASNPPRQIPAIVWKRAVKGSGMVGLVLFGIFFGGMGLLFTKIFFPWSIIQELSLDLGNPATTDGRITVVEETNMTVNESTVWRYEFSFEDATETAHTGICFRTGSPWAAQETRTIEYLESNPSVARISGTSLDEAGKFGAFVIIFPLVGFGIIFVHVHTRRRKRHLLKNGLLAEAQVIDVFGTKTRINYKQVFKITFAFQGWDGRSHEAKLRTHHDHLISLATKRQQAEQNVYLFYDSKKPKRVFFAESLIDE
ncbi:hypothetical protein [Rubellicoccus peritrichatus]|uniref:DUF3592 domain-containing protein n=1 Tax=Rubellicoccus peritrichatus TaxID=3080537 RepID=A0AAQ3LJ34_9BACT|nr:hypothetical protein [Puniceicoccus sp. CR14]WOO43084.1 hypothetical protein RZN69_08260 [Puniceicoccus sp. CR14]